MTQCAAMSIRFDSVEPVSLTFLQNPEVSDTLRLNDGFAQSLLNSGLNGVCCKFIGAEIIDFRAVQVVVAK